MSSLVDKALSGVKWGIGLKVLTQVFSWVVTIYVIRMLSPHDYAMVALVDLAVSSLLVLGTIGIGGAIIRRDDISKRNLESLFFILIALNFLFFLILFFLNGFIENYFNQPGLGMAVMVMSILLLISPISTICNALIIKSLKFKELESIRFFSTILQLLTNFILAFLGYGYWSILIGMIVGNVSKSILMMINLRIILLPKLSLSNIYPIIIDAKNNFIQSIVWEINDKIPSIFISKIIGNEALGFYTMSRSLSEKPVNLSGNVIQSVGLSSFSKIKDNERTLSEYITKSTSVIALVMIPVFVGLAAVAEDLVPLALGETWVEAILPFQIISIAQIFNILRINIGSALFAAGYGYKKLIQSIVALFVFIISWVLGLNIGFIEGCLMFLSGFSVWFIWSIYDASKVIFIDLSEYSKCILVPVFSSLIMFLGVFYIDNNYLSNMEVYQQLIIEVLFGIILYIVALFVLGRKQIIFVLKLINR